MSSTSSRMLVAPGPAQPVYAVNRTGMMSVLIFGGGLVSAAALILEHRGHRYASVTLLVAAAIAGGTVLALKNWSEGNALSAG